MTYILYTKGRELYLLEEHNNAFYKIKQGVAATTYSMATPYSLNLTFLRPDSSYYEIRRSDFMCDIDNEIVRQIYLLYR